MGLVHHLFILPILVDLQLELFKLFIQLQDLFLLFKQQELQQKLVKIFALIE
jgi:hypothetical protein